MAMACHGVVGLQHATMAMYNAWCDRVPVLVMGGNIMEADKRAPGAEWVHAGVDIGALVRDFTKWDDQPASLHAFRRVGGARLQDRDHAADGAGVPLARCRAAGKPDPRCGVAAHSEVLAGGAAAGRFRRRSPKRRRCWSRRKTRSSLPIAWRARRPGMANLVALAEALQCAVIDNGGRMNFPSRHPLNQSFRRGADRPGRRHPRDRDERPLGHAHALQRPHRAHARSRPTSRAPRSSRSACATCI